MSSTNEQEDLASEETVDFGETLLEVDGLSKYFQNQSGFLAGLTVDSDGGIPRPTIDREWVRAVDDVSFDIRKGETLGLVGESGCGKSTLARTVLRLLEPTDGDVLFKGDNLAEMGGENLRSTRRDMQMIFQDPQSSLDPRMKVGPIVEEPLRAHDMLDEDGREERARELLGRVGLDPQHYNRYPHQFSGGQRQRINLARAMSVNPDFIVCDEPTSALDASIQAQVLNTMRELQDDFGLTYLFISHDLSVIRHISDRVAVMYLGEIVEIAEKEELFENPQHPYTDALLSAIPVPDPRKSGTRSSLAGDVPSPIDPPSGCRFRTRCPELIAPAAYDMSEEAWADVREFMRAVDRGTFSMDAFTPVRDRFFPDGVPSDAVDDVVDEAVELLEDDEWDEAESLLAAEFDDRTAFALADDEWDQVREFRRAVEGRTFDLEEFTPVRDRFFPDGLPAGDAGTIVEEAIDALHADEWDEARSLVVEEFAEKSICAKETPSYDVEPEYGDGRHFAACHRHRDA
ncbi:MAG: ABC transporter ATP-binding protein [Halanaeroarchaeum sp.]